MKGSNLKFWIPMGLTLFRLVAGPLLIPLSRAGALDPAYLPVFIAGFSADVLDGMLARKWGVASKIGARIDSMADAVFWISTAISIFRFQPAWISSFALLVYLVLFTQLTSWAFSFVKFRRLPAYHTKLAKCVAVCLFVGVVVFVAWHADAALLLALALLLASNCEDILLTAALKTPEVDISEAGSGDSPKPGF